jgi:hypothetical protein
VTLPPVLISGKSLLDVMAIHFDPSFPPDSYLFKRHRLQKPAVIFLRNVLRMNLYQAQAEVDLRKEKLIEEIEARLQQKFERSELFLIRWKAV